MPGRVVVMSAQALGWLEDTLQSLDGAAEGETLWRALQARAREACQDGATQASPESYERLAALVSYVTPLSHREACCLCWCCRPAACSSANPVQAVQALLTRLFVAGQPSQELAACDSSSSRRRSSSVLMPLSGPSGTRWRRSGRPARSRVRRGRAGRYGHLPGRDVAGAGSPGLLASAGPAVGRGRVRDIASAVEPSRGRDGRQSGRRPA